jgi:hypothetical protein
MMYVCVYVYYPPLSFYALGRSDVQLADSSQFFSNGNYM